MNKELEEAIVNVEKWKTEISDFIENHLSTLAKDAMSEEIIKQMFISAVILNDSSVNAIMVLNQLLEHLKERLAKYENG